MTETTTVQCRSQTELLNPASVLHTHYRLPTEMVSASIIFMFKYLLYTSNVELVLFNIIMLGKIPLIVTNSESTPVRDFPRESTNAIGIDVNFPLYLIIERYLLICFILLSSSHWKKFERNISIF